MVYRIIIFLFGKSMLERLEMLLYLKKNFFLWD
jgi:hypothetical protein